MTRAAGAARPPLFSFEGVRLGYDGDDVLEAISLHVSRGDLVGLVGPNGAGKTTLLRAVLGTLVPRAGRVVWAAGRPARIGYVPQRESLDALWPIRVTDLVLMGRTARAGRRRRFGRDDLRSAAEALGRVGIAELGDCRPSELSGGQVQRALIARALAGEPELLILDEPTTGMDLAGTAAMLGLIRSLHARGDLTLLVVSHDLGVIAAVAERIALLHERRLREGDHDSILSPEVLGAVYRLPIEVAIRGGARVVFPPLPPEETRP